MMKKIAPRAARDFAREKGIGIGSNTETANNADKFFSFLKEKFKEIFIYYHISLIII